MRKDIVKSTWVFCKKRKPSGEVSRCKSRLCVRGDLTKNTCTSDEVFAPVVDWIAVRMLFALGVVENWQTALTDFKNAFAQAKLPEPLCPELPPGFQHANPGHKDKVVRVNTSLCGDARAANLWCKKIAKTLINDLKFSAAELDPCLFVRHDCIVVLCVDDAIVLSRDRAGVGKLR